MKLFFYLFSFFLLIGISSNSQSVTNKIDSNTFENFKNSYNYTFWDNSFKTRGAQRSFTNQTSSYGFTINFTTLAIENLSCEPNFVTKEKGLKALKSAIYSSVQSGSIDYAILQNDTVKYAKSSSPTSQGLKDSQLAEYGVWKNTRFVSTNFTNSAPVLNFYTGIEFATWHNRLKISFHVQPTDSVSNGRLKLAVTLPSAYSSYLTSGAIHAFSLPSDKGFALKAGITVDSLQIVGNKIIIYSANQNLMIGQSYEISLLLKALPSNLSSQYATAFNEEAPIAITGSQTLPSNNNLNSQISYNSDEGVHYINMPRVNMGYFNCGLTGLMQSANFDLVNSDTIDKRVKVCFQKVPNVNVTGFNSLLCNENGDPSGLPLQISKNWHNGTPQLFSGSWIREYTEVLIPANTTLKITYRSTGAKWGETFTASSHQLSVVGAGVPRGGWLEAALGTFGESITHSPDYEYGNTNGADIRPFLVTNGAYGGTSSQCGWTGNVGGLDMWVYEDSNGNRKYQSQVKTDFKKYSPNLTETTISAVTSDDKLKLSYTFYLNRSDDFTRVYYRVKVKALQHTSFSRFDIFQLGGDIYNAHNTRKLAYGNDTGRIAEFIPTNNGLNDYTTPEIPLPGKNPWIWAGEGLYFNGATSGIEIDANNGLIVRGYKASFNGQAYNTPYFRERSSSKGFSSSRGINPTSYCLVTPPTINNFAVGDSIELLAEMVVLPKQRVDYYGPNVNFGAALDSFGNTFELLLREAKGNQIIASSPTHVIDTNYPLSVFASNDEALVTITGGKGYIPLVFKGLTNVDSPTLWKSDSNCWQLVDQSVHGKDFWQSEFNPTTGLFDLIYNVNQDRNNDSTAHTVYFLGQTPPVLQHIVQSKITGSPWTIQHTIGLREGSDSLTLAPQLIQFGLTTQGVDSNWIWTDSNTFVSQGRVLQFLQVDSTQFGTYYATYSNEFGCQVTQAYTLFQDTDRDGIADSIDIETYSSDIVIECDSHTWINGITYTLSNNSATDTLVNVAGGDSIISLTLIINNSSSSNSSQTACNSFTWSQTGITYNVSGTYKDTIANSQGCDSVISLLLTINNPTSLSVNQSACNSFTWSQTGITYNVSGTYKDTITNSQGCDSVISLLLTINIPTSSSMSQAACNSYTWSQTGITYNVSGTYVDTITNRQGCDSVISLLLTINNPSSSSLSQTACNSFIWSQTGITYNFSGTYKDTITNTKGCDSVISLVLVIFNGPVISLQPTNQSVIVGQNVQFQTLATGSSVTYQWQENDGTGFTNISNSGIYSGTTTGTLSINGVTSAIQQNNYRCIISDVNGCSDTTTAALLSISLTSLDENGLEDNFNLFPNPVSSTLTIKSSISYSSGTIMNALGQTVLNFNNEKTLDVSKLVTGNYTILFKGENDEFIVAKKFIKR